MSTIIPLSQVFVRPDGSRRTREEAIRLVGLRAVWVAELNEAVQVQLEAAPPLSVPPRIFISYRWGSEADNDWVANLAESLRERGYGVQFDRHDKPPDLPVPEFVARIAGCHWFLAVIDPGYIERVGTYTPTTTYDGWVFDEYNLAAHLAFGNRIRMVGLVRKGEQLPRGFRYPQPGRSGNAADVRDAKQLTAALDQVFPPVRNVPPRDQLAAAEKLIQASHEAAKQGRLDDAFRLAGDAAAACPGIIDGHAQLARVATRLPRAAKGLQAAKRALEINPDELEMLLIAAACAYDRGLASEAAQYCVSILDRDVGRATKNYVAAAHYYLGNVLDDLSRSHAAVAHLEISRAMAPDIASRHNDAGVAYRRLDEIDKALSCFADGLELEPNSIDLLLNQAAALAEAGRVVESRLSLQRLAQVRPDHPAIRPLTTVLDAWEANGGPLPRLLPRPAPIDANKITSCSRCSARVPLPARKVVLCAGCGDSRTAEPGACEVCGRDGVVPVGIAIPGVSVICPFCREGALKLTSAAG